MMRRTALVLLISLGRRGGDADAQVTTCRFTNDGDCDVDRGTCVAGSDCADCPNDVECGASAGMAPEGENTCTWANDDTCDFPTHCAAGTDCDDCPGDVACAHGGQQGQPPPPSGPVGECGEVCDDSWCTSEYTDTAPRSNTIFYDGHDCYAGNVEVYSDSDYEDPIYGEGCFCSEGRPKLDGRTWNRIVREGYRGQMGTTFDDSCMDGRTCAVVYYQYTCCKNTCESYRDGFEDPVRYPTDEGCCGDVCKSGQSGFGSQGGNCLIFPFIIFLLVGVGVVAASISGYIDQGRENAEFQAHGVTIEGRVIAKNITVTVTSSRNGGRRRTNHYHLTYGFCVPGASGETGPWNKVMKHQEVLGGDYNQCFEGGKVNIVHIQQITGNPKNAILEFNLNHEAMRVCSVISAVIVGGIFTLFAGSAILGSCSYVTVGFVSFAVGLCCVSCRMISLNGVKKRRSDPDGDSEEVSAAQAQAFNSGQAMQPQAWGNPEAPFTPGMGGGSKWDLVQPAPCGTMMMVTCPEGATVGTFLCVTSPAGQQMQVAVPLNVNPGDVFQVVLPAAAPVLPVATAVIMNPMDDTSAPAAPVVASAPPPAESLAAEQPVAYELKAANNMPTL